MTVSFIRFQEQVSVNLWNFFSMYMKTFRKWSPLPHTYRLILSHKVIKILGGALNIMAPPKAIINLSENRWLHAPEGSSVYLRRVQNLFAMYIIQFPLVWIVQMFPFGTNSVFANYKNIVFKKLPLKTRNWLIGVTVTALHLNVLLKEMQFCFL